MAGSPTAGKHGPQPPAHFDGGKSATAVILIILTFFFGTALLGGGGIIVTYMTMKDDGDETAASATGPTTGDPFASNRNNSRPPNVNITRPPVTSANKIESVDDALKALGGSSSTQRDAARWLARQSVSSQHQTAVARALGQRLLTGSSFYANDMLNALEVWGNRESGVILADALKKRRGDTRKILQLLTKFPDPKSAETIAEHLNSSSTASNAAAALKAIGPQAKEFVLKFVGSSNRSADENARQLLKEWNVDVDSALLERYVKDLQSDNRDARAKAAKHFARANLIEERRDSIATGLEAMLLHSDDHGKTDALAAIKTWGDKDSIPAIIHVAQKGGRGSSPAAMDLLAELKDPRGAAAMCGILKDFFKYKKAKEVLTKMGKEVAEVEVVKFVNDPDARTREQVRLLLHSFGTDDSLILTQCIADLGTAELARHQGAAEWLANAKVIDERPNEVADRLATLLDTKDFRLKGNVTKAFAAWATAKHADKMYALLKDRNAEVRKNALKTLVVAGDIKLLAPELDKMLASSTTRNDAAEILNQAGPAAEDLMTVMLLGSANEDVLLVVCEYFFHYGSKDAMPSLSKFRTAAAKAKKQKLVDALRRAASAITTRGDKPPDAPPTTTQP